MFQKKKKKARKNKNDTVLNFHVLPFIDNKTFDANIGLPVTYCARLIIFATKCLTCFGRGPSIVSIKVGFIKFRKVPRKTRMVEFKLSKSASLPH